MYVARLELVDFRNYRDAAVDLEPGVTVFVGPNGQGKTNLVEAIGYLASGGSHRVSADAPLVRTGADAAVVRSRLEHRGRQVAVDAQINRTGGNRLQVNGRVVRARDAVRYLDSVLFAPEDLAIVRGEPGVRRRFLDELLVMRQPRLGGVLGDYDRVLRQRNTLLKSARAARVPTSNVTTLDVWDSQLAELGAAIGAARRELVADLAPHAAEAYRAIAGDEHSLGLALEATGGDDAEEFLERLRRRRAEEIDRAVTLVGPHRDDLTIELSGMPARSTASHGESWSTAIALRLGSAQLLREHAPAGDPVIILDDVFAELDARRRRRLVEAVVGFEQVLVTAAVAEDVPEGLAGRTVHIRAGEIVDVEGPATGGRDDGGDRS